MSTGLPGLRNSLSVSDVEARKLFLAAGYVFLLFSFSCCLPTIVFAQAHFKLLC